MTNQASRTEPAEGGRAAAQAGARRSLRLALVVAVGMGGLSFAAVPLYEAFCRVTGFGGTPLRADAAPDVVSDQTIRVLFDANTHRDMPWEFDAVETEMTVRIGETGLAYYRAHNPTDRTITGVATFNVAPFDIGGYFSKIACFCFEEQTLEPGQSVDMPVTFFVDPAILKDEEHAGLSTITLSYTFFVSEETASAQ